jgi:hypothetical protein
MKLEKTEVRVLPDGRMDTNNAALYIGLSEKTLAMMRCKGAGPEFVKCGGRIFYFREDLDIWITASGKLNSTQQTVANNFPPKYEVN